MKAAARILLVVALTVSVGLHWAAVQSVAWMGMVVTYSVQQGSVLRGLSDTFDGQHACSLCQVVEEGTKKSTPQDDSAPTKDGKTFKLHMAVVTASPIVFNAPQTPRWITKSVTGEARPSSPEAPPPRSVERAQSAHA